MVKKKKPTSAMAPTEANDNCEHELEENEARRAERDGGEEELLTYPETSKMTGLKLGTLYAKVKHHEIPHVRLGRRLVRFRRSEIKRWLNDASVPVGKAVA